MSILGSKLKLYSIYHYDDVNRRFFGVFVGYCIVIGLLGSALYGLRIADIIQSKQCVLRPIINYFAGMCFSGMMVTFIQMEAFSKPFSFCLPDRGKTTRKLIFSIGVFITLAFSLISYALSEHTFSLLFMHLIVIPVTGLPFYIFTAFFLLNTYNDLPNKYVGICSSLVAIILSLSIGINFKNDQIIPLNQFAIFCLIPLFISFLLGTSAVWKILGDDHLARKHFRGIFNLSNNRRFDEEAHESASSKIEEKNELIENLLLDKLIDQPIFSVSRSVLGTFYLILERLWGYTGQSLTIKIVLPSLFIFLFGYIQKNQEVDSCFIVYPISYFLFIYSWKHILMFKPLSREMLFPIGRSKQFRIDLILWFVKLAIMMFWFSLIIAASRILRNHMPEFTLLDYNFTYTPLEISLLFWPAVIIPVIDIFLSFPEPPCHLATMVFFIIALAVLTGFFFANSNIVTPILSMTLLISISNGFYLILMVRYWSRCDNV